MTVKNLEVVDLFSDFGLDNTAEDGVWVPYRGGVEFLIAYSKSKKFKTRAASLYKKASKDLPRGKELTTDQIAEVVTQVVAETVLLGWRGPLQFKGKPLEYSVAAARQLLELGEFQEWVDAQANELAQFKAVKEAEELGN